MKRIYTLLLLLCTAVTSCFAYDFTYNGVGYQYLDEYHHTCCVVSYNIYNKYKGEITIPETAIAYDKPCTVVAIGSRAFENCTDLTKINLPNSLTTIGDYAFENCTGLTEINLPNSLTEIGDGAFSRCTGLTEINLPNSLTTIGDFAFSRCTGLTELTIPESVREMYSTALSDTGIKKLTFLPGNEDLIWYTSSEYDCGRKNLEVLDLGRKFPEGKVQDEDGKTYNIEPDFAEYPALTKVNFSANFTRVPKGFFRGCTALRSVTIPQTIEYIGDEAFSGCTALKLLNIEDSETPITIESSSNSDGTGTTFNANPIETLYLGRNVIYKSTELSPFKSLTALTTLTIGNKVTDINDFLFYGCANIDMLAVPSSVKRVGSYAFYDCQNSKSLMISASVETIGEYAFYNCKELSRISIPKSVKEIGDYAFRNCNKAASITLGNALTTIGNYAFLDCYGAKSISFGQSVKTIGNNAFYNCSACEGFILPNSVVSIGDNAFALCVSATEVKTGDSVKTIGMRAFADCESLNTVTISPAIESIGDFAFFNCENLAEINIKAATPPAAYENVFSNYGSALHVPLGSTAAYKAATDYCWPLFSVISEKEFEVSGIDAIGADTGDDMYFTLQGVRVNAQGLEPGIYVRVRGGKAEKIQVK